MELQEKEAQKTKAYMKSLYKEPTIKVSVKKLSSCVRKETAYIDILVTSGNGDRKTCSLLG